MLSGINKAARNSVFACIWSLAKIFVPQIRLPTVTIYLIVSCFYFLQRILTDDLKRTYLIMNDGCQ